MSEQVQPTQPPRGPKDGAAWPTPKRWKDAIRLRLEDLGWSQSDLAREVSKEVEATPAAISYVLTKAKQSSLRPAIENAVGWKFLERNRNWQEPDNDPEIAELEKQLSEETLGSEFYSKYKSTLDQTRSAVRDIVGGADRRELITIFESMPGDYRERLLIEARYLLALFQAERTRTDAQRRALDTAEMAREHTMRAQESVVHVAGEMHATEAQLRRTQERVEDARALIEATRAAQKDLDAEISRVEETLASLPAVPGDKIEQARREQLELNKQSAKVGKSANRAMTRYNELQLMTYEDERRLAFETLEGLRARQKDLRERLGRSLVEEAAARHRLAREEELVRKIRELRRLAEIDVEPDDEETPA